MVKTLWKVETYGSLRGYVSAGNKKSAFKKAKLDPKFKDTIWWKNGKATNLKVKRVGEL